MELGGTISTQHGTGLARTPWVARQYGPLFPVFRQLKAIFDPHGIFNPGKIIGPDPQLPPWPLRSGLPAQAEPAQRHLRWQPGDDPQGDRPAATAAASAGRRPGPAHVPDLSRHPRRSGHAARQGEPVPSSAAGRDRSAHCSHPTRCAPWPTCASIARCAPWSARPTSTCRS